MIYYLESQHGIIIHIENKLLNCRIQDRYEHYQKFELNYPQLSRLRSPVRPQEIIT